MRTFATTTVVGFLTSQVKFGASKNGKENATFFMEFITGEAGFSTKAWVQAYASQMEACRQLKMGDAAIVIGIPGAKMMDGKNGKPYAIMSIFASNVVTIGSARDTADKRFEEHRTDHPAPPVQSPSGAPTKPSADDEIPF